MPQALAPVQLYPDDVMTIVSDALGTMAFVCAMPPEGSPAAPASPVRVRLAFHVPGTEQTRATFELLAGEAFGHLLAANILGDPTAAPTLAEAQDALREVVNVAGGALARHHEAAGGEPLAMGIPTVAPSNATAWAELAAAVDAVVLDADGHPVAARFTML